MDDVSFSIEKGEIVGVVGESGSGKSVTCHSILASSLHAQVRIEGVTKLRSRTFKTFETCFTVSTGQKDFNGFSGSYELPESVYDHS